jgi:restriction system protein
VRVKVWVLVGIAAVVAAYASGAGLWWSLAIGVAAPAVIALTPRFLLGTLVGARTPGARENPTAVMSGTEFEDHVARVARTCGVPVIMTPLSGDWGVDLIVGHRPNRLAIQCKRYSRPIGPGAVQEVVAGAPMQDCTRTMVVSNQDFTPAARRLAERHGCALVGGTELVRLSSAIRTALS